MRKLVEARLSWMDDVTARIDHFDIDAEPPGWLQVAMSETPLISS